MTATPLAGCVYQGIDALEPSLERELGAWEDRWGSLFYAPGAARSAFWCQNIWLEPFRLEFDSITEAVGALRAIQRNWAPVLHTQFRRGALIGQQLPPISSRPRSFPWLYPEAPMGAWTLLDAHTLIASPRCTSPFPAGTLALEEDRINPPSRAYLKLQEALIRARVWPQAGDRCLDAGASPGGWTWVLARLGARVVAVDRAPLDERVLALPGVEYRKHDAFTLKPEDLGPMDWVCSDVICYPPRLYEWVETWLASGLGRNYVCTIKMQGEGDDETTRRFAALPGGRVVHLNQNKHELTWIKVGEPPDSQADN